MSDEEIFDADFLGRLRSLFFKLRRRKQLQRKGPQNTQVIGHTREFKDHRHYVPGDDFRNIDWKLYARLERIFIRLYEEVQEFHVHIIIDRSKSMAAPYKDKRIAALRMAVALAYLALGGGHKVSILSIGDDCRREIPPRKGQGHIHGMIQHLVDMPFDAVTDLDSSLRQVRIGRDRRGMVFLLSDLFGQDPEQSAEVIAKTVKWPAETHVVQLINPAERDPTLDGELRLLDVESGEIRRMWLTQRDRERYRRVFDAFVDGINRTCVQRQIDHMLWRTDTQFEDAFIELLSRGNSLAGA